jgi:hypothetical protein
MANLKIIQKDIKMIRKDIKMIRKDKKRKYQKRQIGILYWENYAVAVDPKTKEIHPIQTEKLSQTEKLFQTA